MSRWYDRQGNPQNQIPVADGTRLRPTTIADAKKHDWVASVSTICAIIKADDFLTQWKVGQFLDAAKGTGDLLASNHETWKAVVRKKADIEMSKAPDLGSRIHRAVEHYHRLKAEGDTKALASLSEYEPDILPYLVSLHNFCEENDIKANSVESLEKCVVVEEARTAGTADFIGTWAGRDIILDWKTQKVKRSPWFYFQFPLQLAAYWKGLGGRGQIVSVIIDTSGHAGYDIDQGVLPTIHFKFWDNPLKYYKYFLDLSGLYYHIHDWEERRV